MIRVNLVSGYYGRMGALTCSREIQMPFPPTNDMDFIVGPLNLSAADCFPVTWDANCERYSVMVNDLHDDDFSRRRTTCIEDVAAHFKALGWCIDDGSTEQPER